MSHLQSRWLLLCRAKSWRDYDAPDIPAALILTHVSRATSVDVAALRGPDRRVRLVRARQMAMYAMRECGHKFAAIGATLHRDHSTVCHGVQAVRTELARSPELRAWAAELLDNIKREVTE